MIQKTPIHLWVVGILAILWNSIGAVDYLMTQTQNEAYMASYTQTQLDYFYNLPFWAVCSWAIAIWSGVLGSLLLLLRKKLCVSIFLLSLIGLVINTIHTFLLSNGYEIMGGGIVIAFPILIFIIAMALFLYSRNLAAKGVLN